MNHTAESVRTLLEANQERLFAPYLVGRPPGWSCDQRTRDVICLTLLLREQMQGLDELGRKQLEAEFNRYSRSDQDLFVLAADILNKAAADNIDRARLPHHRWG